MGIHGINKPTEGWFDLGEISPAVDPKAWLSTLHPAYFALVMATGILSIACHLYGLTILSCFLFSVNVFAYIFLWICTLARIFWFPKNYLEDWSSHQRAPGFFTYVAATSVLGSQFAMIGGSVSIAHFFWWFTLIQWLGFTYAIFVALAIKEVKPTLAQGINGGWLVSVVATQSVCVLGIFVKDVIPFSPEIIDFTLISLWLAGGMLYLWLISLIFYRYMFFPFSPADLVPPYWINMGAMAISTLAGASLSAHFEHSLIFGPLVPFVKGVTIAYWATATWWIPMLVLLGIWRHGAKGVPLKYDPLYWGLVFPLGMYSTATLKLAGILGCGFLLPFAKAFLLLGLSAWLTCFMGMLQNSFLSVLWVWREKFPKVEPISAPFEIEPVGLTSISPLSKN